MLHSMPPKYIPDGEERVCGHEERSLAGSRSVGPVPVGIASPDEEEGEADAHHPHAEQCGGGDESQKVAVVAPAYAGAHPGAVVVKLGHAVVTHRAVGAAGRAVVRAGRTELCRHAVAVDVVLPCGRTVGLFLGVGHVRSGVETGIAEGCSDEEKGC